MGFIAIERDKTIVKTVHFTTNVRKYKITQKSNSKIFPNCECKSIPISKTKLYFL